MDKFWPVTRYGGPKWVGGGWGSTPVAAGYIRLLRALRRSPQPPRPSENTSPHRAAGVSTESGLEPPATAGSALYLLHLQPHANLKPAPNPTLSMMTTVHHAPSEMRAHTFAPSATRCRGVYLVGVGEVEAMGQTSSTPAPNLTTVTGAFRKHARARTRSHEGAVAGGGERRTRFYHAPQSPNNTRNCWTLARSLGGWEEGRREWGVRVIRVPDAGGRSFGGRTRRHECGACTRRWRSGCWCTGCGSAAQPAAADFGAFAQTCYFSTSNP
ncbi:hypothetical protein C8J57DRAFT_1458406 [Mycena rebaudengoi]|nr:hypothetical protein C8J57DRAFT_1458406 [Mycena rebaudengoi]